MQFLVEEETQIGVGGGREAIAAGGALRGG
jgi:hypothetical protein